MTALMHHVDGQDGTVAVEEFENLFWLFAVAGNETVRNGLPGGMFALLKHPDEMRGCARTGRCSTPPSRRCCAGGRRSSTSGGPPPTDTDRRQRPGPQGRESRRVVLLGQPRRGGLRRRRRRFDVGRTTRTTIWRSATARTSAWAPIWHACRCARCSPRCSTACTRSNLAGKPVRGSGPTSRTASNACRSAGTSHRADASAAAGGSIARGPPPEGRRDFRAPGSPVALCSSATSGGTSSEARLTSAAARSPHRASTQRRNSLGRCRTRVSRSLAANVTSTQRRKRTTGGRDARGPDEIAAPGARRVGVAAWSRDSSSSAPFLTVPTRQGSGVRGRDRSAF